MHLADGASLPYDVLVVATGVRLLPEETEGLLGPGWNERVFTFYDARRRDEAARRARALRGRPARRQHRRHADQVPGRADRVRVPRRLVPARAGHPRPHRDRARDAARRLLHEADRLEAPDAPARREGDRARDRVQRRRGRRRRAQARLVRRPRDPVRPARRPSRCTAAPRTSSAREGLGDALGFVPTDPATLQAHAAPNVFALGDATDLPTSKAGSVTHFEGEMLTENIERFLAGRELDAALRRARELLRRDRLPQGAADRLQLRHRAAAGTLPDRGRPAPAAPRVAAEPPRQADVPVGLLAHAAARARDAARRRRRCRPPASASRRRPERGAR